MASRKRRKKKEKRLPTMTTSPVRLNQFRNTDVRRGTVETCSTGASMFLCYEFLEISDGG
jgi:hypothetical protein